MAGYQGKEPGWMEFWRTWPQATEALGIQGKQLTGGWMGTGGKWLIRGWKCGADPEDFFSLVWEML